MQSGFFCFPLKTMVCLEWREPARGAVVQEYRLRAQAMKEGESVGDAQSGHHPGDEVARHVRVGASCDAERRVHEESQPVQLRGDEVERDVDVETDGQVDHPRGWNVQEGGFRWVHMTVSDEVLDLGLVRELDRRQPVEAAGKIEPYGRTRPRGPVQLGSSASANSVLVEVENRAADEQRQMVLVRTTYQSDAGTVSLVKIRHLREVEFPQTAGFEPRLGVEALGEGGGGEDRDEHEDGEGGDDATHLELLG
jgi:hypothetical protein